MKTALMVAEKPSLATSLANILSNGSNSTRKGQCKGSKLTVNNKKKLLIYRDFSVGLMYRDFGVGVLFCVYDYVD